MEEAILSAASDCSTTQTEKGLASNLLQTVEDWIIGCHDQEVSTARDDAKDAITNHTEESTFTESAKRANSALAELLQRAVKLDEPANPAEIQLAAKFWVHIGFLEASRIAADRYMASYRTSHLDLDYRSTLLSLYTVQYESLSIISFMTHYEWKPPACAPPHGLDNQLRVALYDAIHSYEENGDKESETLTSQPEGYLLQLLRPNVEEALSRGSARWPEKLFLLDSLNRSIAYFSIGPTQPLPTQEEAMFLVSLVRAERRTLWGDSRLESLGTNIASATAWTERLAKEALSAESLVASAVQVPCA